MMLHGRKGGQHLAGQVILEVLLGCALLQKNSREPKDKVKGLI
jgi:hypothetical protein